MPTLAPMRVLFVAERYPPAPGGVAASAARIARALAATWGPVQVLALDPGSPAGATVAATDADLPVVRVGAAGPREAAATAVLREAGAFLAAPPEGPGRPDRGPAVFGHFAGEAGFLAVLHARLAGVPAVVSIRGNDLDRGGLGDDGFARLLWTLQNADAVTAVTREHGRKAAALAARDDVRFAPNVVDTSRVFPVAAPPSLAAELGLREGDEVVGFSGELRPRKGLYQLLEALAFLAASRPRVRLLLLGGVHPESRGLFAAAVRQRGLGARIAEAPYVSAPEALVARYALCRVLAFPSLADGMPNALLEAMAAARPCVATAVGGAPDAIEEGRSGLLVPPGDAPALARALASLLDDPSRARALGEAARKRVEGHFGPERERADLLALRDALARRLPEEPNGGPGVGPAGGGGRRRQR